MKKLIAWDWPGNIRELENFIERSVILTRGTILQVPLDELTHGKRAIPLAGTRESGEREEILRVLKATNGRVAGADGAAERLGLPRTTLISRMEEARNRRATSVIGSGRAAGAARIRACDRRTQEIG